MNADKTCVLDIDGTLLDHRDRMQRIGVDPHAATCLAGRDTDVAALMLGCENDLPMAGAKAFLELMRTRGVGVLLMTSRFEEYRGQTLTALRRGYAYLLRDAPLLMRPGTAVTVPTAVLKVIWATALVSLGRQVLYVDDDEASRDAVSTLPGCRAFAAPACFGSPGEVVKCLVV